MSWRKWFVRGLVFTIAGACAMGYLLYQRWTNPAAVREQVLAKLKSYFPGAQVTLDNASLRLFGGIQVHDLRLTRKDDSQADVASIPSAILYHDKEKILDGALTFRKVLLHRPRLRLQRGPDGAWNFQGLTSSLPSQAALPTLVIHQGTLILDDRADDAKPTTLEISDVNLTIINDPLQVVHFTGSGRSELTGKIQLKGQYQRESRELSLTVKAPELPLTTALVEKIRPLCRQDKLNGLMLEGKADIEVRVGYQPSAEVPFSYDVRCQVKPTTIHHPLLPFPLRQVQATLAISQGLVRVEKFVAVAGAAEMRGSALGLLPNLDQTFEANLEVSHLALTETLFAKLPEKMQLLYKAFQPKGLATVKIACAKRGGQWTRRTDGGVSTMQLIPEGLELCFARFPYPLREMTGLVELNLLTNQTNVDAAGLAGGSPFVLRGIWRGQGTEAEARFDLQAADVPLDDMILNALPVSFQKLARSFNATGRGDIKGYIRLLPGNPVYQNEFHVRFHECTVAWDYFPYPLKEVSGYLDIYPHYCEFREFQGTHNGGQVALQGKLVQKNNDPKSPYGLSLDIQGTKIQLNQDLHQAFTPMPQMARAYETFRPVGAMNFHAVIDRPDTQKPDMDLRLSVANAGAEPVFFPYRLEAIAGQFRYDGQRLEITDFSAKHQQTRIRLDHGLVKLFPGGGYFADLPELIVHNLYVDETLIRALPKMLQGTAASMQLKDPVILKSRVVVSQGAEPGSLPDLGWDGLLWLKNATLTAGIEFSNVTGVLAARGRYNGRQMQGLTGNVLLDQATVYKQPFRRVQANFQITEANPDLMLVGLKAPLFGGDVSGQMRIHFGSDFRYGMNLTASQIDLEQLAQHNQLGPKSKMSGLAEGRLVLTGQGASRETLDGNGAIDVRNGKLINLPFLIDLIKFLGLRWPDRTAFEELHALFNINGPRMGIRRLDLVGNAVSLSGQGELNLDGTDLNLDFYPSWARMDQFLPQAARPFPPIVSKNLMTIEVRGKVGGGKDDMQFHMRPLPAVVDPLMQIRNLIWEKN